MWTESDESETFALVNIDDLQLAIRAIIERFLTSIDTDIDGKSLRWWPMEKSQPVVIDPRRSFGQPIVDREGVPTLLLAEQVSIIKSAPAVAYWYEVEINAVEAAHRYETEYTKRVKKAA